MTQRMAVIAPGVALACCRSASAGERARLARDLHDTLLQSFHASLIQMQTAGNIFARRPEAGIQALDNAIDSAEQAINEGWRTIQDLRATGAVYQIGHEVLRNAFRHAHARRIEAEIRYDTLNLRLRIRDDGKGIDRNILEEGARAGHWGLQGIRDRAKRIRGRFGLFRKNVV